MKEIRVSDLVFLHMIHGDADDLTKAAIVEAPCRWILVKKNNLRCHDNVFGGISSFNHDHD